MNRGHEGAPAISDLIISVEAPARIYHTARRYEGPLFLRGSVTSPRQWTPWPALPDVLIHEPTQTLVGLEYGIPVAYEEAVQQLCSHFDTSVVRCLFDSGYGVVHVIWGAGEWDTMMPGQLVEVGWHYAHRPQPTPTVRNSWTELLCSEGVDTELEFPVAIAIDIDDVLELYGLRLPDSFVVPLENAGQILPVTTDSASP